MESLKPKDTIISDIVLCLVKTVPNPNWEIIRTEVYMILTFNRMNFKYFIGEVKYSFKLEGENFWSFSQSCDLLRKNSAIINQEKGTWYTFRLEVNHEGKFEVEFDYDNKPNFTIELDDEDYIEDFEQYPRDPQYIPEWLREILVRHGKF